jgi:hypothetical protein
LLNVQYVAVVTAIAAQIALYPLKCLADVREQGAEVAFCVGGMLGQCHRCAVSAYHCHNKVISL